MSAIAGLASERVHGWFRLLTETLGRRKHFAVSFLTPSPDTPHRKMEEMILLDDPPAAPSSSSSSPSPAPGTGVTRAAPDAGKGVGKGRGSSSKAPSGQTPYTISVTVTRGGYGYGFSVAWTRPPRVEAVDPGSPAEEAGLMPGDYIIFVGHHNIVKAEEDAVLEMIKECGDTLPLEVYRRGVSKPPRGLANGTPSSLAPPSEHHPPRPKLSHISFTSEEGQGDRQAAVYALINCEQAFSNSCRFGIERYLIPLKFRTDLLTQTEHEALFNNMDQLVDLSEVLIDRMMGNSDVSIGEDVGKGYYTMLEELTDHYARYMGGLPEADKVLAIKYQEADFREFLQVPQVPRKKPDITTLIHKPAEHLRELLGLLGQVYTSDPSHQDNTYLDAVLDKLKTCYRGVTSQQNIMEPSPPAPPLPARPCDAAMAATAAACPTTPPITLTSPAHSTPLRPPLVSVADIEKRLVFTKYTQQPFKLNDGSREWVFGGELHKFEGRHLREYWAMLFSDLILFTKINRDRVIFVMEDPVPIAAVCQACFTVKKKATEFRLIIDTRIKVSAGDPGNGGHLTNNHHHHTHTRNDSSGGGSGGSLRGHKKTLVLRAPTVDLKATWNNLIRRQLYLSLAGSLSVPPASVSQAASRDGLHTLSPPVSRFTSSVGDLSRGLRDDEGLLDLNDDQETSSSSCFRSSKLTVKQRHGQEEELILEDNNDYLSRHFTSPPPSSSAPPTIVPSTVRNDANLPDFKFVVEDEPCDSGRSPSRRTARTPKPSRSKSKAKPKPKPKAAKSPRSGKVRRGQARRNSGGGGCGVPQCEEVVFNLDQDEQQVSASRSVRTAEENQSALQNNRGNGITERAVSERSVDKPASDDNSYENYNDEEEEDDGLVIEDVKTGLQTQLNSKKGKGIGGKVRDKFFPSRNLPTKKKMNRTKKVEKYVDSLDLTDLDNHGRVTPLFIGEERLSSEDFNKKRKDILLRKPKNFMEGDEEEIDLDPSYLSPQNKVKDIRKSEQKKRGKMGLCAGGSEEDYELECPTSATEEKTTGLTLEGINENGQGSSSPYPPDNNVPSSTTMLSPEEYEQYIGDALEKDYPELTGVSTEPAPPPVQHQEPVVEDYCSEPQNVHQEQQEQQHYPEEPYQEVNYHDQQQAQQEEELMQQEEELMQRQQQYQYQAAALQPTGPLSGSASMNFMDDHSPTGNGNGDFYHQCVAKYPRTPPRKACGSFSLDACSPVGNEALSHRPLETVCSPSVPVETSSHHHNHLNSHECISRFASQFRTSCVTSTGVSSSSSSSGGGGGAGGGNGSAVTMCVDGSDGHDDRGDKTRPRKTTTTTTTTTSVVNHVLPSASTSDSRTNSTSTSERSSMSISSATTSSSVSNINKNRSSLFLPTSTTSLPEISVEPPTPQAPKPKDSYDRENKVKYDLLVPGYRSMFLTVPGIEDHYSDRFLPRYSLNDENGEEDQVEEESSSDDDVVHKPKALAFLTGVAENRGLKRYGSSCDIDRLTSRGMESESTYTYDDNCNGNYDSNNLTSKVGGTGSGAFVAGKLAMFEKVVEEEHQKFIECQEVRKRIFRMPRKSGEYIEKFYSPQVIDSVDARAIERGNSPSFYDDEYAEYTATSETPYGGRSSPPNLSKNRASHSTRYTPSRSPSPNSLRSPPKSPSPVLRSSSPFVKSPSPQRARSATPKSPPLSPLPVHKSPTPRFQVTSPGHYDNLDGYDFAGGGRPLSPDSTRQSTPTPIACQSPRINFMNQENTSLQQRTNEALEMLDMSYLDDLPWGVDAPPDFSSSSPPLPRGSQSSGRDSCSMGGGGRRQEERGDYCDNEGRCRSPPPPPATTTTTTTTSASRSPPPTSTTPDALDDVFEIEDEESMGSTTSIGGRRNKRAAPKRPQTPPNGSSSSGGGGSNNKIGGFFGRVKKGMEADVDKVKKMKDRVRKSKEDVKKERKDEAKTAGGGGKRFQLFGGAKKSSEPATTAEDLPKSPKKDKAGGKKRLFGRGGKENFLGRSPNLEHYHDPQVARMAGDSFDQESLNLDEGEEIL